LALFAQRRSQASQICQTKEKTSGLPSGVFNCDRVPSGLAGRGLERSTYLQFGLVPFIYLFIFRLSQVLNVARAEAYETEKRSGKFVRRQEKAA